MATEALVTDQTAEGHVEEMKLTDDIKNVDGESCSQPKDLEGKDEEEKLKVEDSASVEASATESEEKPEDKKSDTIVEEVKKEEAEDDKAPAVEVDKADVTDIPEPPKEAIEKRAEDTEASLVQESESEAAKEPAVLETLTEKLKGAEELPEVSYVAETEGESAEPQILATVTESAPDTITSPDVSESAEISQDEKLSAKELEVNHYESSKEEPSVTDLSKLEEVFDKVQEAVLSESSDAVAVEAGPVNELKEVGEGAVIPEEVPDVPEKTEVGQNANRGVEDSVREENGSGATDISPVLIETSEALVKPEDKVEEEMEEKATVVEEPTVSETTETDAAAVVTEVPSEGSGGVEKAEEQKDGSLDVKLEDKVEEEMEEKAAVVEEPTMSETTETDAATVVTEVSSEVSGGVEKAEEQKNGILEGIVETSKDLGATSKVALDSSEGEKASGGVEVVEKKDESLDAEKTTLVENSRGFDVDGGETNIITSAENSVNENSGDKKEEMEKADEQNLVESTKDGGEAPKQEVPAKPSQRQSNSIISKVKQSIVKVKKAIIGKSPSLKTMTAEGKDDIKV